MSDLSEMTVPCIICEHPFVKLLTAPKWQEYELAPGYIQGRWEALAQVNEVLAIIEVSERSDT